MKEITKRITSLLLAAASMTAFAGCASDQPTETTATSSEAPSSEPESRFSLLSDQQIKDYTALITKFNSRAKAIADATQSAYMKTDNDGNITLSETYSVLSKRPIGSNISSAWHYMSFMSMTSHLYAISSETDQKNYSDLYASLYDSLAFYKGTGAVTTYKGTSRVTYYGVHRASSKGGANVTGIEAVYDDQMWYIMDLMDMYNYTNNADYMKEAVRLANICIDGWDVGTDKNGKEYGGIPWGPGYSSKHTCSNAPLISPLVDISTAYKAQGNTEKAEYYLNWAVKIYDWVFSHLKNSSGVYGDLLGSDRSKEGDKYVTSSQSSSIDQTAYTYNTGTMLSGAAALYLATGDTKYISDAERLAKNADRNFRKIVNDVPLYPITSSTTWFNFILLQGYTDLAEALAIYSTTVGSTSKFEKNMEYITYMQESIEYAFDNYNKDGFLPRNYAEGWDKTNDFDKNKNIMDQASAAESYALLSMLYTELLELNASLSES